MTGKDRCTLYLVHADGGDPMALKVPRKERLYALRCVELYEASLIKPGCLMPAPLRALVDRKKDWTHAAIEDVADDGEVEILGERQRPGREIMTITIDDEENTEPEVYTIDDDENTAPCAAPKARARLLASILHNATVWPLPAPACLSCHSTQLPPAMTS